jgi:hypothetical protein
MNLSRMCVALALTLPVAACAPDAWRPDSPYEAFLSQVQNKCWNLDLGTHEINGLLNGSDDATSASTYFLDLTSRFFNGRITEDNYVGALSTFFNTKPYSPAINCILAQMPANPQQLAPLIKY